jgi:hypothetical protein
MAHNFGAKHAMLCLLRQTSKQLACHFQDVAAAGHATGYSGGTADGAGARSGRFDVGFDVADLADQAIWSRRGGEAVVLVELAGVVVYGVDDDVPATRLLARRHRSGKGIVQQDPAQTGAPQLPGQGKPGQQDRGDLPGHG